tara:strand:- start:7020 stop:7508 length:489 start_codon:yes stop_codon:yes gene_type:complete
MSDTSRNPFTRNNVKREEYAHTRHSVTVPADFDPKESLDPHMWSLVAEPNGMRAGDEIRVMPDDQSWVQRLVVTFNKGSIVHVAQESLVQLKTSAARPKKAAAKDEATEDHGDARYIAKHQGFGKWGVFDTKAVNQDNQWIEKDMASKEEAEARLAELLTPA